MGLIKSKQEKEIEQRMLVKRSVVGMKKQLEKLEQAKKKYVELAQKAVQKGNKAQANMAISGLKIILNQIKTIETMQMNFELAAQMKDITSMTKEFLNGMSVLSKEMSKTAQGMDFAKVQKEFEVAMDGMQKTMDNMDILMESSEDSFSSLTIGEEIDDEEINALINTGASTNESNIDLDIENKLNEVAELLK